MIPEKPSNQIRFDQFRLQLDSIINRNHELYRLAEMIDWSVFDESFDSLYCPNKRCPDKPTRLMVGLQMLKHLYGMSDEEAVDRWVENPYWQKFCGEVYFQHKLPINPSSMTRYRKRIGESGCELILQLTVTVGVTSKAVKPSGPKRVTVATTVQKKAVFKLHHVALRVLWIKGMIDASSYQHGQNHPSYYQSPTSATRSIPNCCLSLAIYVST